MKTKTLLPLLLALTPSLTFAHNLSVGKSVPPVNVAAYGEIVLQGEGVAYQPGQLNICKAKFVLFKPSQAVAVQKR